MQWKIHVDSCAQFIVEIELVESLLRPDNLEVSWRYVLKHATCRRQQHLPALRHIRKAELLCGQQKTMVGKSGKRRCEAGEWEKRGVRPWVSRSQGKSSAVPQQHSTNSSASPKLVGRPEKKIIGKVMEERRRRRIAFENSAKEMLRYLDNSDDMKVGITELQEKLEVPVQIGISIQQVAQQAMNKVAKRFSKCSGKKNDNYVLPSGPDGKRTGKA